MQRWSSLCTRTRGYFSHEASQKYRILWGCSNAASLLQLVESRFQMSAAGMSGGRQGPKAVYRGPQTADKGATAGRRLSEAPVRGWRA